jgi:thymidylate synthase (FAD)
METNILNKGFLKIIDTMGSDLRIVNSARVSFGKQKETFDKNDRKLIKYLAKHKHFSPFRHCMVCFHIKAPEFVMRQWYKHVVGCETTSNSATKDHAWNEISGRYVPIKDFYYPDNYRKQSKNNKQGSDGFVVNQTKSSKIWNDTIHNCIISYQKLIDLGVAKEQARCILPLAQYTEVYWTASLQAIINFIKLRDESTSQWEIRQYAIAMKEMMFKLFPEAITVLLDDQVVETKV